MTDIPFLPRAEDDPALAAEFAKWEAVSAAELSAQVALLTTQLSEAYAALTYQGDAHHTYRRRALALVRAGRIWRTGYRVEKDMRVSGLARQVRLKAQVAGMKQDVDELKQMVSDEQDRAERAEAERDTLRQHIESAAPALTPWYSFTASADSAALAAPMVDAAPPWPEIVSNRELTQAEKDYPLQESFQDAVLNDPDMTPEQKAKWLAAAPPRPRPRHE